MLRDQPLFPRRALALLLAFAVLLSPVRGFTQAQQSKSGKTSASPGVTSVPGFVGSSNLDPSLPTLSVVPSLAPSLVAPTLPPSLIMGALAPALPTPALPKTVDAASYDAFARFALASGLPVTGLSSEALPVAKGAAPTRQAAAARESGTTKNSIDDSGGIPAALPDLRRYAGEIRAQAREEMLELSEPDRRDRADIEFEAAFNRIRAARTVEVSQFRAEAAASRINNERPGLAEIGAMPREVLSNKGSEELLKPDKEYRAADERLRDSKSLTEALLNEGAPDNIAATAASIRRTEQLSLKRAGKRDKIFRPRTTLGALYRGMLADPFVKVNMMAALRDDSLSTNTGMRADDPQQATRRELLAMTREKTVRPAVVDALVADLRERSDTIEAAITAAAKIDPASQAYDYVVIGAGIHDQIFQNVVTNRDSSLKGLTVTDTDGIAETFSMAGDFFSLNSTNRPTRAGVLPLPGSGNLNELPGGPVQVSDLDASKFPAARSLGDATTLNRASASADILFRNGAAVVRDSRLSGAQWPARYQVELYGTQGRSRFVYTDRVYDATGVGRPDVGVSDPASVELIEESYRAAAVNPTAPIGLWSAEGFIRRANHTDTPYRELVDKEVVIVGGRDKAKGDSAKVLLEWLLRLSPSAGFGMDVAQMGQVKGIDWVGVSAKDCEEYIVNTRARYAGIAGGFKSGTVKGVDGQLQSIVRVGPRFRLIYKMRDGSTRTKDADVVVLATGQIQETYRRYASLTQTDSFGVRFSARSPLQNSDAVEEVRANIPGLGVTTVAKRLKGHEIYFMGPNGGKLVDPAEQAGVLENAASIYATGQRTAALAEMLARQEPRGFARLDREEPVPVTTPSQGNGRAYLLTRAFRSAPIRAFQPGQQAYIRARLASALMAFRFPAAMTLEVRFTRRPGGSFALDTTPAMGETMLLAKRLHRDMRFVEAVVSLLNGEENQLVVKAAIDPNAAEKEPAVEMTLRTGAAPTMLEVLGDYRASARMPAGAQSSSPASGPVYAGRAPLAVLADDYFRFRSKFSVDAQASNRKERILEALRLRRSVREERAARKRALLARAFLLSRTLERSPDQILQRFQDSTSGGQYRSLNLEGAAEELESFPIWALSNLSGKLSATSNDRSLDFSIELNGYRKFLASPGVSKESAVRLYILSRLLGRDAAELAADYAKFVPAIQKEFGTTSDTLSVFYVARLLGRDARQFYEEYRAFSLAADSAARPPAVREKIFALSKLLGKDRDALLREFDDFSAGSSLSADERISLFLVPFAQKSLIDAKQALFL